MNAPLFLELWSLPGEEPGEAIDLMFESVRTEAPDIDCHGCQISIAVPSDETKPTVTYVRCEMISATRTIEQIVGVFESKGYYQSESARAALQTKETV